MPMTGVDGLIVIASFTGLAFALQQFRVIQRTKVVPSLNGGERQVLSNNVSTEQMDSMFEIYDAVKQGAAAFLAAEYRIVALFVSVFAVVVFVLIGWGQGPEEGLLTMLSFVVGALTSMLSGYIGMTVAVFSNARTTIAATAMDENARWTGAFNMAFRAGGCMGFCLCSMGLLVLWFLLIFLTFFFDVDEYDVMMDCISGYGLGGSAIAMFGRVGGGIYTKAADVGADLVGKCDIGLEEDSPRNPATIADNVGDNVGDVAGMSADLFGSFAESTCAALVISASSTNMRAAGWNALLFPLSISALGLFICMASSFVATHLFPVRSQPDVEKALKRQLVITTFAVIPGSLVLSYSLLPSEFTLNGVSQAEFTANPGMAFVCVSAGALGGLIIGIVTEFYTSFSYKPVREVANACNHGGAATCIIYGLALGYQSCIVPVFVLASIIYLAFSLCDTWGVALGAIGMLSTLATGLTIDGYGPVCDNAGGIAEMTMPELEDYVRDTTDALDAAGNTTAAIGKGFAIGSAALVSLALYGAFVVRLGIQGGVNVLEPLTFSFLLIGSMLPYWFSAMTMKSVGEAAGEMVDEVKRQIKAQPGILNGDVKPDYQRCIAISTTASLREMVAPAALVMLAPLIAGTFFGVYAVFGILTGGLVSGVQMAVSMSNTGGAWDNAKKYIEGKHSDIPALRGKHTPVHAAAVVGDTVGDPLKDTSGPALNILMKLMAILSLVFASYFEAINEGRGIFNVSVHTEAASI